KPCEPVKLTRRSSSARRKNSTTFTPRRAVGERANELAKLTICPVMVKLLTLCSPGAPWTHFLKEDALLRTSLSTWVWRSVVIWLRFLKSRLVRHDQTSMALLASSWFTEQRQTAGE